VCYEPLELQQRPSGTLRSYEACARARPTSPELVSEWTKLDPVGRLKARIHLTNQGVAVPHDAGIATIGPLTIRQLNLFAHKAVLGLHFEHFRSPLFDAGRICAFWRSKEDFARDGIPQFFLDMLPGYGTLAQGRWNERRRSNIGMRSTTQRACSGAWRVSGVAFRLWLHGEGMPLPSPVMMLTG